MTFKLMPRGAVWPHELPSNMNGTPRPLLRPGRPWLTIHYTGGGTWLDPGDTPSEMRAIQDYAAGPGKATPWEYNWVIDGQGVIWEYAGDYRAAHSGGENDDAIGVLLLVGFKGKYPDGIEYWEHPPTVMITAVRQLRFVLVERGMLAADHKMLPHKEMPGAATACPGQAVMAAWSLLTAPWTTTPPAVGDDEMYLAYLDDGTVCVVGSAVRPVSSEEIEPGGILAGLPRVTPVPGSNQHYWLRMGVDEYIRRVQGDG